MHLTRFLKHKKNQPNKKEVSERCVRMVEIFKNVIIKKKWMKKLMHLKNNYDLNTRS